MLGPLEAEHSGRVLTPSRRQERCLLGVLLLEANASVPTDRLASLLWDGSPPGRARATLQTYVSRLRGLFDPNGDGGLGLRLIRDGDGYSAQTAPDTVDALRFQSLDR